MIDFIKILVLDAALINYFKNHSLLIWFSKNEKLSHIDNETIYSKEIKVYKGILFCFYDKKLEILFKPHYYFNNNLHNANKFSSTDCIHVITEFIKSFNIKDSQKLKIINIEYGINLVTPYKSKDLITFLSYHSKNEFRSDSGLPFSKKAYSTNKNGISNKHKTIKVYAKGIQHPEYCSEDTIRYEIKSQKSSYIKTLSIETINNLLNPKTYEILAINILKEWDSVLILGLVNSTNKLNTKENNLLLKYQNPHYWYRIKQQHRNQFNNTKQTYIKLLNKIGHNPHTIIKKIMDKKLKQMCAILPPQQKKKTYANSPINIMTNCTFYTDYPLKF